MRKTVFCFVLCFILLFSQISPAFAITAPPADVKLKYIALTFDDGPDAKNTPRLLSILEKYNAKATFFVIGQNAQKNPNILETIIEKGHALGNHTYDHKNMAKQSRAQMRTEIQKTYRLIKKSSYKGPGMLRPPYGAYNKAVLAAARANNLSVILWSIDPKDWHVRDAKKVANSVISKVKDGDIILLHDIYKTSVEAAEIILKTLSQSGYVFVTVPELIEHNNANITDKPVWNNAR